MRLIPPLDPPLETLITVNPRETAYMRRFGPPREGSDGPCTWQPLIAISPLLVAAVVKTEDARFFNHRGVDWHAIAHILRTAVRTRRLVGGGSTITQQLARNLYLTPDRSLTRKLRELWLALQIDRALAKTRVLELYLNLIEWGPGVWGCAAAGREYFGKPPAELDLFESTFLASLIAAPKAPLTGRNAARSRSTQNWLVYRMFLSGLADGDECAACLRSVSDVHRRLAEGLPLAAALARSSDANAGGDDGALLCDVAAALGLRRLAAAEVVPSRCGVEQELSAILRLRARFGDDVLLEVLRTNNHAALRSRAPVSDGRARAARSGGHDERDSSVPRHRGL